MLQKNFILLTYKILNTTGWSFLQFTLILHVQDFKSFKLYLYSMESESKLQEVLFVLL